MDRCTEWSQRAAIYRDAAKRMEDQRPSLAGFYEYCGCCEAIACSIPKAMEGADLESPFVAVFKPEDVHGYWWDGDCVCVKPDSLGPRILALCFMAAMVEAGDA